MLDDLSLSVSRHEIVSIVGPSGVGRSSLLMCLRGILRPDRGSVEVDGQSVTRAPRRQRDRIRRERFGFVLQSGDLVPS